MRCLVLRFTGFKEKPQKRFTERKREPFTNIVSNGYVQSKKVSVLMFAKNLQLVFFN